MRLKKSLCPLCLCGAISLLASPAFAGGYTLGVNAGFHPDPYRLNTSVSETSRQLQRKVAERNRINPGDASIEEESSTVFGIPFGFNVRYLERYYIVRFGMLYQLSSGGFNSITIGKKTGNKQTISVDYATRRFEVPLTFALNLKNDSYTRLYAGAGLSIFHGSVQTIKDSGKSSLTPDTDLWSGWSLGYHIMFGGELAFSDSVSISTELFFTIGQRAPLEDESITPAGKQNIQDAENKDKPEILGVYDPNHAMSDVVYDPQHPDGLIFSGVQLFIGINFYL